MTNKRSLLVIILWVIALSILAAYIFLIVSGKKTITASWFTTQITRAVLISILALIVGIQFNKLQKNDLTRNEKKRAATSFYFALFVFTSVGLLSIVATPAAPVSAEIKNVATTADMVALQKSNQKIFEQGTRITTGLETISKHQESQHRYVDTKLTTLSDAILTADKGAQARHYAVQESIDTLNNRLVAVAGQLEALPKIKEKVDTLEGQLKEMSNTTSKDGARTESSKFPVLVWIGIICIIVVILSLLSSKTDWGNKFVPPKLRTHYIPWTFGGIAVLVSVLYFFANSEIDIDFLEKKSKKDSIVSVIPVKKVDQKDSTTTKEEPKKQQEQNPPKENNTIDGKKPSSVEGKPGNIRGQPKKHPRKFQRQRRVVRAPYPWM